jgi:hypothetical protein
LLLYLIINEISRNVDYKTEKHYLHFFPYLSVHTSLLIEKFQVYLVESEKN